MFMTLTGELSWQRLRRSAVDFHSKQVAQLWQKDRASSTNDFRWGSICGYYRLNSYFSRHCDMTQFMLTHHMVNKPFLILGLAAEYRFRRRRRWCDKHCGRPSDVYDTDRRTKLIALETTSRWLLLKKRKVGVSRRGSIILSADFRGNWASPTKHSWYQSSRVIALSCGIKISAVHHLVLSQSTRVTDGQTDRRTDGQTDRIMTPKTTLAYARAVKTTAKRTEKKQ